MIRDDLKARVIAWAEARNFFGEGGATVEGQLAKLLEEASELVTDIVRGRDATDSVGDCLVVLTILERMGVKFIWPVDIGVRKDAIRSACDFSSDVAYWLGWSDTSECFAYALLDAAAALNIDPNTALEHALREIEPRRGSWSGGVFVKEASK